MVKKLAENDMVAVYALRDIMNAKGGVAVKAGTREMVFTVDARERVSKHPKDWSLKAPAGVARPVAEDDPEEGALSALGLNKKMTLALQRAGYNDLDALSEATVDDLTNVKGIGERTAESILEQVSNTLDDGDDDGEEA